MAFEAQFYSVSLFNDDYTPMEFVVYVLEDCFELDREGAQRLILRIHNRGAAECGFYPREIAEQKVAEVMALAHTHGHPLECVSAPAQR